MAAVLELVPRLSRDESTSTLHVSLLASETTSEKKCKMGWKMSKWEIEKALYFSLAFKANWLVILLVGMDERDKVNEPTVLLYRG